MVSKSLDLEKIKQRTAELSKSWQKKLSYLSESVSRSGIDGASHWLKSHHQIDDLKSALEDLVKASEQEEFQLSQVETTLSSFVLPEEDIGQADWYRAAGQLIVDFEKTLVEEGRFDEKKMSALLNELKFISQADEFHHRYQIQSIQQKVTKVYQTLMQALSDFKSSEREKIKLHKDQEQIKLAQIEADKAQAEAKKATMEAVKIKEKRLAIIEEKKRRIAEKELLEVQNHHDMEKSELLAKQAETERQAKLQDAYVDLQLEEKISNWAVTDIVELLQKKLEQTSLSDDLRLKVNNLILDLSTPQD